MRCRICDSPESTPLWADTGGNIWRRCLLCGSDTSSVSYSAPHYSDEYLTSSLARTGGMDAAREQVRSLIEWFGHHKGGCPDRSFLDVGCLEGVTEEELSKVPITYVDGLNDRWQEAPAFSSHL